MRDKNQNWQTASYFQSYLFNIIFEVRLGNLCGKARGNLQNISEYVCNTCMHILLTTCKRTAHASAGLTARISLVGLTARISLVGYFLNKLWKTHTGTSIKHMQVKWLKALCCDSYGANLNGSNKWTFNFTTPGLLKWTVENRLRVLGPLKHLKSSN